MKSTLKTSRYAVRLFLASCLAMALVGTAWACTTSPTISPSQSSGAAGTLVTIDGSFVPTGKSSRGMPSAGTVEVRWDSPQGGLVGTGNAGETFSAQRTNLSVPVAIPPDAAPGVYYLVAIQKDMTGNVIGKASGTFEVTGPPATDLSGTAPRSLARSTSAENLWSGFRSTMNLPDSAGADEGQAGGPSPASGVALLAAGALGALGSLAVALRTRRMRRNDMAKAGRR